MLDDVPSIRQQLEQDENIQRLLRSLALAEHFRLYIVYCNAPRLTTELLTLIDTQVSAEREEPIRLIRLNPHQKHSNVREPIPANLVIDEVLTRLVSPSEEMRDSSVIVVVDGSYAAPLDDEAWLLMFQRMNERRNVISQVLRGPLVLVLPKRFEMGLAHAAPDVWSIRSLIVTVRATLPEPVVDLPITAFAHAASTTPTMGAQTTENLDEWESELRRARALVASSPDDPAAEGALLVALIRATSAHFPGGNYAHAASLVDEALAIARLTYSRMPGESVVHAILRLLLRLRAFIHVQSGDIDAAIAVLDEAVSLLRIAMQSAPDDIVAVAELLDVVAQRANLLRQMGHWDASLAAYEEARDIAQSLVERDPARTEWLYRLGTNLAQIGMLHLDQAQDETAVHAFLQSLQHLGDFLDKQPDASTARELLVMTLASLGTTFWRQGETDRALESFERAVAQGHELRTHLPDHLNVLTAVVSSVDAIGYIYLQRGDLDRAMARAEQGATYGREALARSPHDAGVAIGLALSLELLGDVHTARKEWDLADAAYSEAGSHLRAIEGADSLGQQVNANLARIADKLAKLTETRTGANLKTP